MRTLENEYRQCLRRYPPRWRNHHEDALVGVLLDMADAEGRDFITAAERRDLARTGARHWFRRTAAQAPFVLACAFIVLSIALFATGLSLNHIVYWPVPPVLASLVGSTMSNLFVAQPGWAIHTCNVAAAAAATAVGLHMRPRYHRIVSTQ